MQNQNDMLEFLEKENEDLKRRLELCAKWMQKEVKAQLLKIARRKTASLTENSKENFLKENQEQIITKRIQDYFWEFLLLNAPTKTLEYLVISEINFYNYQVNPNLDGFNVISSYHKIFDSLIEQVITNNYRKFCLKNGQTTIRANDPLEKALHLVVNKKYILWVWRLYWIVKSIKNDEKLYDYWRFFKVYLDKNPDLRDLILSDEFYNLFTKVVNSEVFWAKRHAGKINFKDTNDTRKIMVGDFLDKTSIFYMFLKSQSIGI